MEEFQDKTTIMVDENHPACHGNSVSQYDELDD